MPKVHYFVTTGESGQKMYGTCLTVWEGHEVTLEDRDCDISRDNVRGISTTTQVVYLPKCLVILSQHPYLVAFREYLTQLHRLSRMVPPPPDRERFEFENNNNNNNDSEGGSGGGGGGGGGGSGHNNGSTKSGGGGRSSPRPSSPPRKS
jgi:uncharacterized membrane protein YgcG